MIKEELELEMFSENEKDFLYRKYINKGYTYDEAKKRVNEIMNEL